MVFMGFKGIQILQFSLVGETGETYAIDPTGRLISESR